MSTNLEKAMQAVDGAHFGLLLHSLELEISHESGFIGRRSVVKSPVGLEWNQI